MTLGDIYPMLRYFSDHSVICWYHRYWLLILSTCLGGFGYVYSSITLVDPFYGGSSYTNKFEFESFKTKFCLSNSPDVVPIVFISVEKNLEKNLSLKNKKSKKILSHPSLSLVVLWYSKRPAWTHEERVFNGFKNNAIHLEKFAFFCHFSIHFSPVFCKYLGL